MICKYIRVYLSSLKREITLIWSVAWTKSMVMVRSPIASSDTSICSSTFPSFFPGPYSLNGYRVRVYRQDSATQWFTGIITHHDLFSRTMVVMNDQVESVKPAVIIKPMRLY